MRTSRIYFRFKFRHGNEKTSKKKRFFDEEYVEDNISAVNDDPNLGHTSSSTKKISKS